MKIYGNKDTMTVLEVAVKNAIPTLLVGPTGSGKNTILRSVAEAQGRTDIIRLSLTGETTVDDLIGHYQIKDHSTVWQDGSVTEAVRNGHILILDEVNAAQPEVLFALQSLLDDDRSLTLTSHDNTEVKAHENFRVFATMNPTSGYAGTKSMNKAFLSRFGLVLNVGYITAAEERELISAKFPKLDKEDLMVMLDTAQQARKRLSRDELTFPLSTRDLINWATMCLEMKDLTASFNHTIVTKAEGDGNELLGILRRSIEERDSNNDYLNRLLNQIDELVKELSGDNTSGRSLYREDADKAALLLEKLREISTDKMVLKDRAMAEVKETISEARKKIKETAAKLAEESAELERKSKDVWQDGYDKAVADIHKKLGIAVEVKE